MPTTVTSTIHASTGDYGDPQAWEDAIPADLVTADEAHVGQQLDNYSAAANILTVAGHTTDATRTIKYEGDPGNMQMDDDSVALTWNTSYPGIECTAAYAQAIDISDDYVTVERIQARKTVSSSCVLYITAGDNVLVDRCLFTGNARRSSSQPYEICEVTGSGTAILINSLFIDEATTTDAHVVSMVNGNAEMANCSIVCDSGGSGTHLGLFVGYGRPTVTNVAFLGLTATTSKNGGTAWSQITYCASDGVSFPDGSNHDTTLTLADQVEATDGTDWRVKSGNDLGVGTNKSSVNGGIDLYGNTRSTSPYYVGHHEYQAGGDTTISASTKTLSLTENAASVAFDRGVSAGTKAFTLTTYSASLSADTAITSGTQAFTLTTNTADVSVGTNVLTGTATKTLTTNTAIVGYDVAILPAVKTLSLQTRRSTVTLDGAGGKGGFGVDYSSAHLRKLRYQQGLAKDDDEVLAIILASGVLRR